VDVFAFGLVVLELTTMKRLDHSNSYCWPELLESVKDEVCFYITFYTMFQSTHDSLHYHAEMCCQAYLVVGMACKFVSMNMQTLVPKFRDTGLQDAKLFIAKCLGPPEERPTVGELLEDRFFCRKPAPARPPSVTGDDSGLVGRDGSFCGDEQHRGSGAGCAFCGIC
jgi:hypothetical protein